MDSIQLTVESSLTDFSQARRQAVGKAAEIMSDPVIIAWKDDKTNRFGPQLPGASKDRWHDYGESNGGTLELSVGDSFHFIFTEASGFDEPDLNISSIPEDDGTNILCLNDACTEDDRRQMGYFPGGGLRG